MAIIIPSKHIFEIDNQKVRDNVVDNVSIAYKNIAPNNEYDITLWNEKVDLSSFGEELSQVKDDYDIKTEPASEFSLYYAFAYAYLDNTIKHKAGSFSFNRVSNNRYLYPLLKKLNDKGEEENNISFSLRGNKITKDATATWSYNASTVKGTLSDIVFTNENKQEGVVLEIPSLPIKVEMDYYAKISVSGVDYSNSLSGKVNEETCQVNYDIITYSKSIALKGGSLKAASSMPSVDFEVKGSYEEFIPTDLEITIKGNTIGISIEDGAITYIKDASGNIVEGTGKRPFSLDGNELLQDGTTTNGVPTTQWLANNVLSNYQKGKETATIKCSISDYYDADNNKVISVGNKNLITLPYDKKSEEIRGLTFTANADGSVSVNGTHTSTGYTAMLLKSKVALPKGLYRISGGSRGDNIWAQVNITRTDGTVKQVYNTTFRINEGDLIDLYVNTQTQITPNNYIVKPMISKGAKVVPFEAPLPMSFNEGDLVVPMVYTAGGVDKPLSVYQDGTPKVFSVVGIEKTYDGATFQNLHLQEL